MMRNYVLSIARFFNDRQLTLVLLEDYEYTALGREATDMYYSEVHAYVAKETI